MTARDLIVQADKIRQEQKLTQTEWSRRAGFDIYGKIVSNAYARGDIKLSVITELLKPLGYELRIEKIMELEDMP